MAFAEEKGLQLLRTYRTSWPTKIDGVKTYFEALVNTVLLERMRGYVQVSLFGKDETVSFTSCSDSYPRLLGEYAPQSAKEATKMTQNF